MTQLINHSNPPQFHLPVDSSVSILACMLFIKFSNSLKMVLEFSNPKDVLFIRTSLREKEIICLHLFKILLQQKIS
jgi:hypothetical protein